MNLDVMRRKWWLTAHLLVLMPGVRLRYSIPPVQYIQRIVGVGGYPVAVAWWQSTGGSSQRCPGFSRPFHFHLITSKFLYFHHETRCSEHLEWENHSAWVLSWWKEFSSRPLTEFWRHILSGCQVSNWGIQYHLCSTYWGLWELVAVQLL